MKKEDDKKLIRSTSKQLIKSTALIMLETQCFEKVIDWVLSQKIVKDD